jgi:hypothetical protein
VQKNRKEYLAILRFPFCTEIGCHVAMAMSQSVEHHVLGTGFFQSHTENRVVQQLSFRTVAISLKAAAQKI